MKSSTPHALWNAPNALTMLRVVFAVGIFALLPFRFYAVCIVLFLAAAATDYFDGYLARKYNLITVFGRIMDPFADKLLICGCFIYLCAIPELKIPWGIHPWMAVVIFGREMLITSLRAVVEQGGGDFSAKWIGKWKMGLQCVAVPVCLLFLLYPACFYVKITMLITLWGTVLMTIYSGIAYTGNAVRAMKSQKY